MSDDIRVRLSAEGVQDIIAAFNNIRDHAKQSGKEGAEGFTGAFTEGLKELQANLVGFLGIGEVISSIKELFTEVTQGAVSLDKLHQTTGLSTDALQALNAAAKENLISQEELDKGLQFMSRTLGQAEQGSSKAQTALGALGITMKDLKGLNADQQFELIAQRLAEIPDPAQRAAEGAAIFGRNFAQIEPVILDVAEKGIGPFLDRLKELGVYLDGDMIAQLKAVQQNMTEVGEEAKGMATQFLAGFVPNLQTATSELIKSTTSAGSGITTLGDIVGKALDAILLVFEVVGKGIGAAVADGIAGVKSLISADLNILQGNFGAAFNDIKNGLTQSKQLWTSYFQDISTSAKNLFAAPTIAAGKPGNQSTGSGESEDSSAVNKARLSLTQARLQAELALYEAQSKNVSAIQKEAYEQGILSLTDYYTARQAVIQAQGAKEIEILQQRRAAVAAEPIKQGDEAAALEQQAQLATLDGQIATKRAEVHAQVMANTAEERQAQEKLQTSEIETEEKLLELEGKKADAQRLQLGLQAQQLAQSLQKGGASQGQISSAVGGFAQQGSVAIDFTETRTDADAAFTDLQTKINSIKAQVANGQLFPIQGEQQMQQAIKAMLPSLEDYATEMQALANATKTDQNPFGNPTLIAQADQFKQKIDALKLSTDEYGQELANLKQAAQQNLTNGLANALDGIVTGTESVGEAFRNMGESFVNEMIKLETQWLASQFFQWLTGTGGGAAGQAGLSAILGSLFGGGSAAAGGAAIAGGSDAAGIISDAALFAAAGGQLIGPSHAGGGVMVEAEGGEFIVNKSAVSRPGVRSLLEMINGTPGVTTRGTSGLPMFAQGGAVGAGGVINKMRVLNFIDLDAFSAALAENNQFHKTVVNTVIANGNTVRQGIAQS